MTVLGAGRVFVPLSLRMPLIQRRLDTGVVGLSTAIRLQENGFDVNIIAEYLPGDRKTIEYTSPWAVSSLILWVVRLLDKNRSRGHITSAVRKETKFS